MTDIESLKRAQQSRVSDGFIFDYDYIDDNGDKIQDNSYTHPEYGEQTNEVNLTKLFQTSLSTTTDVSLLIGEARLLDEGRIDESSNPHIPATDDVLERAKSQIESQDLTPAWTIFMEQPGDEATEQSTPAD